MAKRIDGLLAIFAALTALLFSSPFAAAYSWAYEPGVSPPWVNSFVRTFPNLFDFTARARVYQIYGRIYSCIRVEIYDS